MGQRSNGDLVALARSLASAFSEPAGGDTDALDALQQRIAGDLGFGGETLQALHLPPLDDDRLEDLVVVLLQVVEVAASDGLGVLLEPGDAGAGHLELAHLALQRGEHQRRCDLQRGRGEVAVEQEVEVLVGGDATDDLVTGLADGMVTECVGDGLARVAMGDPRRQLLQRDVDETVDGRHRVGHLPAAHLAHAAVFDDARVQRSRHREVVAQHDAVAGLFGSPTVRPLTPDALTTEHAVDGLEVVRQVVLGEQVDEQRAAHGRRQCHIGFLPHLVLDEVATQAPRHQLVGIPRLAGVVVALRQPLGHGRQLMEQGALVDHCGGCHAVSLPTGR